MPVTEKTDTDLVIIGGGMMGIAVAYQAALAGISSITLDNSALGEFHYSTHIWAPRADYIKEDIDEVQRTDYECPWLFRLLPDVFKVSRFLIPIGEKTPHSFGDFRALLRLYDEITPNRLKLLPGPSFTLNSLELNAIEPNLKRNSFGRAVGFYELTANPLIVAN